MAKKPLSITFPMPKNANNLHRNEHGFYVATSEGGKTSALKLLPRIKATDQVLFFDPYGDYHGHFKGKAVTVYTTIGDFYKAAAAARKTATPFKIAYTPPVARQKDFDLFCGVVWSLGNGKHRKKLHCVLEEVAQFSLGNAKADGYLGNLISVGRKFGLVVSTLFQRGQEVPKTIIGNSTYKWIGMQERDKDAAYLAEETGVPFEEIKSLVQLEYIIKLPGHKTNYKRGKLSFKTKLAA
ncbi:type IV secretory system conjugative DNA transfer family protein [Vibrio vulnificus]|uniref:type IV secretory system conjugative DNA transfer family protein n=1 Tax=Vibrio vulnificus TaxID=672 RepID=UPI001F5FF134|nr:type IV secretory system conjugative DNA transfer family protein [Vibrio vulnificus]